jgi:hypothetical protein
MTVAIDLDRNHRRRFGADGSDFARRAEQLNTSAGIPRFLQRKAAPGGSGGALEEEADRAERSVSAGGAPVQKKCSCGGGCDNCRQNDDLVQLKPASPAAADADMADAPAEVHDVLRSPGRNLDPEVRSDLETRLGHDFGAVRVHTGAAAESSAAAVNAQAYTVGNDVVFGAGHYDPQSASGRGLLAHELTHVAQQSRSTGPNLQRKASDAAKQCGGSWTCAAAPCEKPDPGREGSADNPSSWTLKIMIDAEAPSAAEVGISTVGHTYVEFTTSTGAAWTYGFYPNKAFGTPDPMFHPQVFGCTVHPDTNHASCVDYVETLNVTQPQFQAALTFAQNICRAPPSYNVQSFNCTTFVRDVALQAGRSLPSIRGSVGRGNAVTADNPYTLIEGLRRRDTGPTYELTSDTDLRNAIAGASSAELSHIPVAEKIRVIGRLLDGWVSDDDMKAIESLCASVATSAEMAQINRALHHREGELSDSQAKRFHNAISRSISSAP